jgi:hypothetical protein
MKEGLDNKFSDEFYQKATAKHLRKKGGKQYEEGEEEEYEESEGQLLYEKQREYYLKMLGEDQIKNLEDLTNLEVQKDAQINNENEQKMLQDNNINNANNLPSQYENENIPQQNQEIQDQAIVEHNCNIYPPNTQFEQNENNHVPVNPLKKKENPALLPPNYELLKNKDNNFVCCVHHSQLPLNYQEKDPRNYQGMPPCMLSSIIPAGKPSHVIAPLNIFNNEQ